MPKIREQRFYSYTFELYEESVPQNFTEELNNLHSKGAYILHNEDIYREADLKKYQENNGGKNPTWKIGDLKKSHYHIFLRFENLKSIKGVLSMLKPLGVTYIEPVHSERGMIRYLIHLDDKDKYQYQRENITTLCGYKIDKFFDSDKDPDEIKQELRNIILNTNAAYTLNFYNFYCYVSKNYSFEYLNVIDKNSYCFNSLINSKAKYKEEEEKNKILKQEKKEKTQQQKEREEFFNDINKIIKQEQELRKIELKADSYKKMNSLKVLYNEVKDKTNLNADELDLKSRIEKYFIEYGKEKERQEFLDLIEQQEQLEKEIG